MIGKTISHYEILEKLGEGGMGEVYLAEDTKLDRRVALKFLPTQLASDEELRARFKREARAAAALNHPNIITIHEVAEYESRPFIAMEYVEGESLKDMIARKRLSVGEVLDVALQISDGLGAAHQAGIVHRDVKPQNILMGKDGRVRICDFGLAKAKRDVTLTQAGSTLGTIAYMSPEQAQGKEVDHRSDIFSFGVVLYEMITGQLPFKGEYEAALAYSIVNENPQPLARYKSDVPDGLQRIVGKAMDKSPEMRYQHVADLRADLRKLRKELEGEALEEQAPTKAQPSIAVLPFANLSADKEQEYFCDGMAEEIINALTHVESLRVVARTSAFSFRGKEIDIRAIGKKLNVGAVLEGSVRKAGNRLRISAQLINVVDGYHLWSERYDQDMGDVFAIQDEISLAIVDKLKVKLLGKERAKLIKRHTEDLDAYNSYLKGRFHWNKRTGESVRKGLEYFQQAVEKDQDYALGYAGLADSNIILGCYSDIVPKEAYTKAKEMALKALEIDDTIAEAHTSLAHIKEWEMDWSGAEREYKRAIQLSANYPTAYHWYANHLARMGRLDEAIAMIKRAQELDPLSLIIITAAAWPVYSCARQYDQAIKELTKALEMDPNFAVARNRLGQVYMLMGMYDEAITELQKAVMLSGGSTYAVASLAHANAVSGKRGEALKLLDDLMSCSNQRYVSPFDIATIYVGLGENDHALGWLKRAFTKPFIYEDFDLEMDPRLDNLRSDPRYTALLEKMGLGK